MKTNYIAIAILALLSIAFMIQNLRIKRERDLEIQKNQTLTILSFNLLVENMYYKIIFDGLFLPSPTPRPSNDNLVKQPLM